MDKSKNMGRRHAIKVFTLAGLGGIAGILTTSAQAGQIGALMPGKGWLKKQGDCYGDGTPLQFIPKTPPDPNPLDDELKKYPRCPYCGMARKMWNFSRHLVHYDDDLVDGTCSIHCLALSLALNIDRGPKAIYAADFGSGERIKPLIDVDNAIYLVGSDLPGTMTRESKRAFSSRKAAERTKNIHGGELMNFERALTRAFLNMAQDTIMIRKKRAAKRKKMKK